MSITVKQSATYDGNDWWEWAVWIEAPKQELEAIDHVVYTLHATFAEPVRIVKTRENGFRLESEGWGEFEIYLEVVDKNGKSQQLTHELSLEYPDSVEVESLEGIVKSGPGTKPPPRAVTPAPKGPGPRAPSKGEEGVPAPAPAARPAAHPSQPAPASAAQRTVYLSSGAADAAFTRELTASLSGRGVRVTTSDNVSPGMPWEDCFKLGIRNADAAVFVVSGRPTLLAKMEMEYGAANTRVIPLLLGTSVAVPASLSGNAAVTVNSADEVDAAANQILAVTGAL
jgi:hypothetical protein